MTKSKGEAEVAGKWSSKAREIRLTTWLKLSISNRKLKNEEREQENNAALVLDSIPISWCLFFFKFSTT